MRAKICIVVTIVVSCIVAIYNIFSGYSHEVSLLTQRAQRAQGEPGDLQIAPWKGTSTLISRTELPLESTDRFGLTDGTPNDIAARKNLHDLLETARQLDTRRNPHFNPKVTHAGHWKKTCFLCEAGLDAKPWPSEFDSLQGTQLLADDYVIERRESLEHFVTKPENKSVLILAPDQAYESERYFGFPGSAFHNGSHFLLFYIAAKAPSLLGLATSVNGVDWQKHLTCACSVCNCTNRLPWWGTGDMCVLHDVHEGDPQHRFKATFNCATPPQWEGKQKEWMNRHQRWKTLYAVNQDNPLCIATSPDGFEWFLQSPMGTAVGDTLACLIHDQVGGDYLFVLRENFATANDFRAIRGTKLQSMSEKAFYETYLDPSQRNKALKKDPWKVRNQWYFDAAFGKPEQYMRQTYAFSRSRDTSGLYWGITHNLEFVVPPRNGTFNPNDKNPAIRALFKNNTKLIGGKKRVDRIMPYLSTSRDGLHFDFWTVYRGQTLDLAPPRSTVLMQPANNVLTPGDGFHHIFFSVSKRHHEDRWTPLTGKDAPSWTENIYASRFKEGRLIGLRTTSGQAWLRTKPFLWPKAVAELGLDVVLDAGANLTVRALCPSIDHASRTWWSCLISADKLGKMENASGQACLKDWWGRERKIQLEFELHGSAQLFSFTVGSPLLGRVQSSAQIRVPTG